SFPQEGVIEPGASRGFTVKQRLIGLPLFTDSGLYPLRVQLLSEERVVATLRTPMIYLIEPPVTPLHLAWTWVLSEPLQLAPDGGRAACGGSPDGRGPGSSAFRSGMPRSRRCSVPGSDPTSGVCWPGGEGRFPPCSAQKPREWRSGRPCRTSTPARPAASPRW